MKVFIPIFMLATFIAGLFVGQATQKQVTLHVEAPAASFPRLPRCIHYEPAGSHYDSWPAPDAISVDVDWYRTGETWHICSDAEHLVSDLAKVKP